MKKYFFSFVICFNVFAVTTYAVEVNKVDVGKLVEHFEEKNITIEDTWKDHDLEDVYGTLVELKRRLGQRTLETKTDNSERPLRIWLMESSMFFPDPIEFNNSSYTLKMETHPDQVKLALEELEGRGVLEQRYKLIWGEVIHHETVEQRVVHATTDKVLNNFKYRFGEFNEHKAASIEFGGSDLHHYDFGLAALYPEVLFSLRCKSSDNAQNNQGRIYSNELYIEEESRGVTYAFTLSLSASACKDLARSIEYITKEDKYRIVFELDNEEDLSISIGTKQLF